MATPDRLKRAASVAALALVLAFPVAPDAWVPGGARPAEARRHKPWRPRWWPRAMSAGTGRAGIVIRLSEQRLYVHDGHRGWTWFKVSTGAGHGTPRGWFRIVTKQRYPAWRYRGAYVPGGVPGNPLGVCWLGLGMPASWHGAPVGLHGTNTPWVIGRPVTHGCVRLRNADALKLYRMVPVGTVVWILP